MSDEMMKVAIRADGRGWSLQVIDLETGKALPVVNGSLKVDFPSTATGHITATVTLLLSELDLNEVQLNPEIQMVKTQ